MPSEYDPKIHRRHSIRLPGYNYSQEGWYFITICTQKHLCLFGEIAEDRMRLSDAGLMIDLWWRKLIGKFLHVQLDGYVIMPNHFHGIIYVGAALCGRPDNQREKLYKSNKIAYNRQGQSHGIAPTIGDIVNWFKTMTTNQYIRGVKINRWKPFPGRLWQRNYYEHIIRDEKELNHFRQYISDNPINWKIDEENPDILP